jgi:hypothetical protein
MKADSSQAENALRKQFFFEKKNQKTFANQGHDVFGPFELADWRKSCVAPGAG